MAGGGFYYEVYLFIGWSSTPFLLHLASDETMMLLQSFMPKSHMLLMRDVVNFQLVVCDLV